MVVAGIGGCDGIVGYVLCCVKEEDGIRGIVRDSGLSDV